jgi:hypothetical protein
LPPDLGRVAPPICSDLIYDKHRHYEGLGDFNGHGKTDLMFFNDASQPN